LPDRGLLLGIRSVRFWYSRFMRIVASISSGSNSTEAGSDGSARALAA
jgi:hypothetical protein